jgi:hypothetical protein
MALTRVTFALKRACKKEERYTVKGSAGRANLKIYFEPGVLPTLKFATQEIYSLLLCKHLIPRFGDHRLCDISRVEIQQYLLEKLKQGFTWETTNHLRHLLSKVMGTAVNWDYILSNPVRDVKMFTPKFVHPTDEIDSLESRCGKIHHRVAVAGHSRNQVCRSGEKNHVVSVGADRRLATDTVPWRLGKRRIDDRHPDRAGNAAARRTKAGISNEDVFEAASWERIAGYQVCGNGIKRHEASVGSEGEPLAGAGTIGHRAVIGERGDAGGGRAARWRPCARIADIDVSLTPHIC